MTAVVPQGPTTVGASGGTGADGGTGAVVGDGTTARSRAAGRWRRARVPLALVAVVALVALLAALPEPRTSATPYAPDNPKPTGARALAQILGRQGVDVQYTRRITDVLAADAPGTTVAVFGDSVLSDVQLSAIADLESDLVLVDAPWAASQVAGIEPASGVPGPSDALGELGEDGGHDDATPRPARCDDPDAVAAGEIVADGSLLAPPGALACFPQSDDASGTTEPDDGAYVVTEAAGRRVAVLASGSLLTNAHLVEAGNAALALRVLGRTEHLVWYLPSWQDAWEGEESDELGATMPPWTGPLLGMLAVVAAVAAVWRGRRLGPLVVEALPVVVRAGETTRGRGRLYRRGRAHGHAAAALRAATASRCAARLGLPRSAAGPDVVLAVARATHRDAHGVDELLYGPPPTTDSDLALLAGRLDDLESEVHRS